MAATYPIKLLLAYKSGNRCALPDCGQELADESMSCIPVNVGEAAHIAGENDGKGVKASARFVASMTDEGSNRSAPPAAPTKQNGSMTRCLGPGVTGVVCQSAPAKSQLMDVVSQQVGLVIAKTLLRKYVEIRGLLSIGAFLVANLGHAQVPLPEASSVKAAPSAKVKVRPGPILLVDMQKDLLRSNQPWMSGLVWIEASRAIKDAAYVFGMVPPIDASRAIVALEGHHDLVGVGAQRVFAEAEGNIRGGEGACGPEQATNLVRLIGTIGGLIDAGENPCMAGPTAVQRVLRKGPEVLEQLVGICGFLTLPTGCIGNGRITASPGVVDTSCREALSQTRPAERSGWDYCSTSIKPSTQWCRGSPPASRE